MTTEQEIPQKDEVVLYILEERLQDHPKVEYLGTIHRDHRDVELVRGADCIAHIIGAVKTPTTDPYELNQIRDEIASGLRPSRASTHYMLVPGNESLEGYLELGVLNFYEVLYKTTVKKVFTSTIYDQEYAEQRGLVERSREEEYTTGDRSRKTFLGIFPDIRLGRLYIDYLNTKSKINNRFASSSVFEEMNLSDYYGRIGSIVSLKYIQDPNLLQEELEEFIDKNKPEVYATHVRDLLHPKTPASE